MKHYILLLLACCLLEVVKAQIPQAPVNLQSPNVASLGLYGDVPVSLFTGTPSIDIPLYTVEDRSIKIPLSLSYHSAGILPDQHPSWVGLGWTLNAGGVIYRTVNGLADDYNDRHYGGKYGYYFNYNVLNTPNWNHIDYLTYIALRDETITDTSPDEFSFNFLDYSGKFYLDHLGNWQVQSDRPLKVTFNGQFLEVPFDKTGTTAVDYGYSTFFSGFTIHAEDGTEYVFGGSTSAIEYSIDFFRQYDGEWIANAWYLTKIITPAGDEAVFTYERGDFTNQLYISVYNVIDYRVKSHSGSWLSVRGPDCQPPAGTSIVEKSYDGKLLAPVYLAGITTSNFKLTFNRTVSEELGYSTDAYYWKHYYRPGGHHFLPILSPGVWDDYPDCLNKLKWYKLRHITIETNPASVSRRIDFTYNNTSTSRLMLSEVHDYVFGTYKQPYKFEYKQAGSLPGYLSNKTDHWGFYNGWFADPSNSNYYALREPNTHVMQYGILDKIIYPTGGYTRFVFEPHSYRKQLQMERWKLDEPLPENKTAGGLRIKQIIQSPTGNLQDEFMDKEYFYVTDYLTNKENATVSSGVLGGRFQYSFNYIVRGASPANVEVRMDVFSSQSVLPACVNSQGSHIGYSEVIERRRNGAFTRFKFTNFDNGHLDEKSDTIIQVSRTPYEPYASKACERGKNTLLEEYAADGTRKRTKAFQYEKSSNDFVRSIKARYKNVCPGEFGGYYCEGTVYRIYTYTYRLSQETDTVFDIPSAPVAVTKKYNYNTYGLIREVSQTTHNGTKKIAYKYPSDSNQGVYPLMASAHIISPVIETAESFVDPTGFSSPLRKNRSNYTSVPLSSGRRIYAVSSIEDSIAPSQWKKTYECFGHDMYGNPTSVVLNEKPVKYQWGYKGQYPVAVFENTGVPSWGEPVQTTGHASLNPRDLPQNVKEYTFYTAKAGNVDITLVGATGYSWSVSGALDGCIFSLFQPKDPGVVLLQAVPLPPFIEYSVTEFTTFVPAGWHTLKIHFTEVLAVMGTPTNAIGDLQYSYWGEGAAIDPKDVFYENFEEHTSNNLISFGYHSNKGYVGKYPVYLPADPTRDYIIDYQVLKNGKWVYTSHAFTNGTYTIDEGENCMIDEVRVYPKNAAASSFSYIPAMGMRSRTNERGVTESYEYDELGRLVAVKDNKSETVKEFDYHYQNQNSGFVRLKYVNIELRQYFLKNDCGPMHLSGHPVEYVVPQGKYDSEISQEDANIKAFYDLMINGQQYANDNCGCGTWIVY